MKKDFLFGMFAMAAFTLVGCSQDEAVNDYSPENAIQFGTYVGRDAQSRASVIDKTALQEADKGFGVFAYYTESDNFNSSSTPNYMWNTHVNMSGGAWTYSPLKYWPNNAEEKISFFAYAPYRTNDATTSNITTLPNKDGAPNINFKVNDEVKNQVDLLWAVDNTDGLPHTDVTKKDAGERIQFQFKHALSRIGFNVVAMFDNLNGDNTGNADTREDNGVKPNATTIHVKNVKLVGKFYTFGALSLNNGTANEPNWINNTIQIPANERTFELKYDGSNVSNSHFVNDVATNVTNGKQKLNAEDSYIMVIPQQFDSDDNQIKVIVEYDVTTTDNNLQDSKVTVSNTIDSGYFKFGFVHGTSYMFNLHIGLTSVCFTADVTAWDPNNPEEYVVNVPLVEVVTP